METARWTANFAFALTVSLSFVCYAMVFSRAGPMEWELGYFVRILVHPLFLLGLVLALISAVIRLVLFHYFGIARTVLASELSVVLMLLLSLLIFREQLALRELLGASLVLTGIWLIGR